MKKQFIFLLSFVLLLISTASIAQQTSQKFPIDPAVRMGTLPNGMKYYIYKNDKPKGLADFYIIHNVGAIQEEDNQNGLAHFLEHMAFNGTKSLPGKMMLNYFQANGVEFGRDINAMTGQDETQYMIKNVPMIREGIIDTAIIAIADWSGGVALQHEEIDAERGVILEEKRTGNSAQRRMQVTFLKALYNGSKYEKRDVIGTDEILKNFKYQEIKDFYQKWYRPDLQAVVIVGDFDIDQMEAKVKKVMGAIPAQKNPAPKENYVIQPFAKDQVCIVKDKEETSTSAMIICHTTKLPESANDTPDAFVNDVVSYIVSSVMNERFSDITKSADAPFLGASFGVQQLTPNNNILSFNVETHEGKLSKGIEAVTKEVKRLYQYGVTDDEVVRVISNLKQSVQAAYDNRADRRNGSISQALIGNYTDNTPILTPEMEYEVYNQVISQLNASAINQLFPNIFVQTPVVIVSMTPDKEGAVPTESELMTSYQAGKNATVEAPKVEKIDRPLVEKEPKAVKIVKESKDEMGNTVWALKNGAKVIVKNTDFRADEIIFSASRDGGTNMVSTDKLIAANVLPSMLSVSGLGTFTANELSKVLSGVSANVSKSLGSYTHGISGSTLKVDLAKMFELIYLSYTAQPMLEKDFEFLMSKMNSSLNNIENQPSYIFREKCNKAMYGADPRVFQMNNENIKNVNLNDIKGVHDMIFDGVDGMEFVFVGSIDEGALKPLVEKYIGSLPKGKKKTQKPTTTDYTKGVISETFPIKLETPKVVYNAIFYTDDVEALSLKSIITLNVLSDILDVKYTKSIREEMGATYGVASKAEALDKPRDRYLIAVGFDTNEDKMRSAGDQVKKEIETIANGSASIKEEIEISKGTRAKNYEKAIRSSNQAWVSYIMNFYQYKNNYPKDYMNTLNAISEQDIRDIAKKILSSGNHMELIMVPTK